MNMKKVIKETVKGGIEEVAEFNIGRALNEIPLKRISVGLKLWYRTYIRPCDRGQVRNKYIECEVVMVEGPEIIIKFPTNTTKKLCHYNHGLLNCNYYYREE